MAEKKKNFLKILTDRFNPVGTHNKKIQKKDKILKSDTATRQEKSVAKVQKAAIKRDRDDVKIADVHAKNKTSMQNRAKKKNEDWKKMRSGKMTREQFIKKYPKSNTAKKYGKRK